VGQLLEVLVGPAGAEEAARKLQRCLQTLLKMHGRALKFLRDQEGGSQEGKEGAGGGCGCWGCTRGRGGPGGRCLEVALVGNLIQQYNHTRSDNEYCWRKEIQ